MGKLKDFVQRHKKGLAIGIPLTLATIAGTYSGTEGGFPPFYNRKVGASGGINIGVYTQFEPDSKFYGISLSLVSNDHGGTINGLNIGLINNAKNYKTEEKVGKVNGLELGLVNGPFKKNNLSKIINGLQIAIIANHATEGNVAQVGVYNSIKGKDGKVKRGFLINHRIRGKGK